MSTGPKNPNSAKNAVKHGIYSREMNADELDIFGGVPLGVLDDEIRLMRIQLRRALARQHEMYDVLELESQTQRDLIGREGARTEETKKIRDYAAIIDRTVGRIQALELARKELNKVDADPSNDEKGPINRIVVEVVSARSAHDHDRATS